MGILDGFGGEITKGLFDLAGGGINAWTQHNASKQEYARQKEFAQNGIRWKVEDAKAAGIHPVFAIGANTPTYSPQAAVGTDFGLSKVGQDIGRAIEAKQTQDERAQSQQIQTEIGQAQADYYRAQADLARTKADLAGQKAVEDALKDIRSDSVSSMASASQRQIRTQQQQPPLPSLGPGFGKDIPLLARVIDPDNTISALIISADLHDAVEDIHLYEMFPYAVVGGRQLYAMYGAKDGATFYGYRWHERTKQWIKDPNYKNTRRLSYKQAFSEPSYKRSQLPKPLPSSSRHIGGPLNIY